MLYIKNDLKFKEKPMIPNTSRIEVQCITIKLKNIDLDVLNVYIPPYNRFRKNYLLHYINQLSQNYIICRDFNAHSRIWEHQTNTITNSVGSAIKSILSENYHISLATPPNLITYTHTANGKTSTIDLCLCPTHLIPSINIKSMTDIASDHYPILIKLAIGPDRMVRGKRRKWIYEEHKWTNWQTEVMSQAPKIADNQEEEITNFMESITVPSQNNFKKSSDKLKERFNKPWWSQECSRATALRKRAKRRMEKTRSQSNIDEYKRLHAQANQILTENFRHYWSKYLSRITSTTPIKEV